MAHEDRAAGPATSASPLARPAFRAIVVARALVGAAYQMQSVSVGWQLYSLTSDPLDLGLVALAQFIPILLLTLPAGHFADRLDRRRIAGVANILGALVGLALALWSFSGTITREGLIVLPVIVGAARAFEFPAMASLWPGTVPREQMAEATAYYSSAAHIAAIVGPALGGALYLLGPEFAYGVSAAALVLGAALVLAVAVDRRPSVREPATLRSVFAGLSFVLSRRDILGAMSLDLVAVMLGAAAALLPVYARDILHAGPAGNGMMRAAISFGSVSVALLLAWRPHTRNVGQRLFLGVVGFGLATIVFALSRNFILSLVALAAMGAADVVSVVIRQSLVQLRTPDEMRGRVVAINSLCISASNQLGDFRAALVAAWLGAVPAVIIGGGSAVVIAILWMAMFPELRRLQRLT